MTFGRSITRNQYCLTVSPGEISSAAVFSLQKMGLFLPHNYESLPRSEITRIHLLSNQRGVGTPPPARPRPDSAVPLTQKPAKPLKFYSPGLIVVEVPVVKCDPAEGQGYYAIGIDPNRRCWPPT